MKKLNFLLLTVLLVTAAMQGCKKGDEGPAGPKGDHGEQGVKGATGVAGEKGATGNANVKVFTKSIDGATWTTVGNANAGYLSLDISAPKVLTADVVDNWVNLVYVKSTDFDSDWALLPYYTNRNIRVTATIKTGLLTLKRDQDGAPYTQSNFFDVKIVSIKPSSTGAIGYKSSTLPNLKSYKEVSAYYGLKD